jgi:DNA primase
MTTSQASKAKDPRDTTRIFQDVKARANLVDYIQHVTNLAPARVGSQIRFNPCPFCGHNDCFTLYGEGMSAYKCHSCDRAGDVFTFAEAHKALAKGDALRDVAQFAGVTLPERKTEWGGGEARPPADSVLQRILEASISHYRLVLASRPELLTWLTAPKAEKGRGHKPATLEAMEVGASDGRLAQALQAQGFTLEQIKAAGLYVEKKGKPGDWRDFFLPGLAIFPHRLPSGEVAHFTLKDPKKEIDYQFRAQNRLDGFAWGNQKAIKAETVILCEGENDLASFIDAGSRNVLASLGSVSAEQIRWIDTHAAGKRFVLWFDYDTKWGDQGQPPAGIKYTRKLYQHLLRNRGCKCVVASALMEPGEDPDDWIQKDIDGAPRRIAAALKKAHNPLLWELKVLPANVREAADATLRYLEEIDFFEYLALLPELERDAVINELQKFGFSRDSVLNSIKHGFDLRETLEQLVASFNGSTKSEGFMRVASMQVWEYFKSHGRFFVSGDKLHIFYEQTIYQIGDNTPFKALMHKLTGINYTTALAKFVWEELRSLCYTRGDRLSEFGWISLLNDDDKPVLYLNLKDPANRILAIAGGEVDLAENGTNAHNVLLSESGQMKKFDYDPEVNVAAAMREMKTLLLDNMSCEPAQRYLLLAWALSAFLLPFSESRALMKMEGMSGSGKTTAAKLMSLLIYGENMVGRSTTASDYSMASTEPLIIKDNLETDDLNRNALNFLLLAATGASNIKRGQGTASEVVKETINCLVAITAIEPFARPELINRTFCVDFSKRWQRKDFVETETVQRMGAKRDDLLSAWLQILAEKVMPSLSERGALIRYAKEQHADFSKERVTEYLSLLVLIAKALLRYMPLSDDLSADAGNRAPEYVLLDAWIKYQNEHSRMIEQGTNAVLQLLNGLKRVFLIEYSRKADTVGNEPLWCELLGLKVAREEIVQDGRGIGHHYYTFRCTTADLLSMMMRYGREYGVRVPFVNAKQLGVRIANEIATIRAEGWSPTADKVIHGNRITLWSWTDYEAPEGDAQACGSPPLPATSAAAPQIAPKAQFS